MTATAEVLCPKCSKVKPASCFHRDRSRASGMAVTCKSCTKVYKSRYHKTLVGRVVKARLNARYRLKRAGGDVRRRAIALKTIALCDRELARLRGEASGP